jgi:alginate O-acetyltransferase complex protein AlgI
MLFNSPEFLFAFLPITLAGFYLLGGLNRPKWAALWLVVTSLYFYGWWKLEFIPLLLGSMAFNFGWGLVLAKHRNRWLLAAGIAANLGVLGIFKYAGWAAQLVNELTALGVPVPHIILPLAISFYTFNQIAYLVDAYVGEARETSFTAYMLFVLFFPHLIAGPIVHHKEMLPQFHRPETYRLNAGNLVIGLTAFGLGLFKKVCIADPLSGYSSIAFGPAADGLAPNMADAWLGATAYTLQLYFDFSGYSDMAIGLALMFNIRLPINFSSPFRATSIVEFWSRFHMTLTRFLTAYIYNPIVMGLTRRRTEAGKPLFNRNKPRLEPYLVLVAFPIITTMTLAGIWHGAGWTFLVFGLWHGLLLAINHGWRAVRKVYGWNRSYGFAGRALAVFITMVCVIIGLVFFKSSSLDQAFAVLQGMAGFGGEALLMNQNFGTKWATLDTAQIFLARLLSSQGALMIGAFLIIYLLPNVPQYIEQVAGTVKQGVADAAKILNWPVIRTVHRLVLPEQPSFLQGSAIGILLALAVLRAISAAPSEFLYFTF